MTDETPRTETNDDHLHLPERTMSTRVESGWERAFWSAMGPDMAARVKADIAERRALADKHDAIAAKYAEAGSTMLAGIHTDAARAIRRSLPT